MQPFQGRNGVFGSNPRVALRLPWAILCDAFSVNQRIAKMHGRDVSNREGDALHRAFLALPRKASLIGRRTSRSGPLRHCLCQAVAHHSEHLPPNRGTHADIGPIPFFPSDPLNYFSDIFLSLLTHLSPYEIIHVSQIWIVMLGLPHRFVCVDVARIVEDYQSKLEPCTFIYDPLELIRVGFLVGPSIRRMNHEIRPMCSLRLCRSLVYTFNPKVISRFHLERDEFNRLSKVGISTTRNKGKVWSRPSPSRFLGPLLSRLVEDETFDDFFGHLALLNVFVNPAIKAAFATRRDSLGGFFDSVDAIYASAETNSFPGLASGN